METQKNELALQTAEIVKVYLERHDVAGDELPKLITDIASALGNVGVAPAPVIPDSETRQNLNRALVERTSQTPAVPIEESVHPDYIICLEDGFKGKVLKRHLRQHGLTPDTYRLKWGLPPDYPLVAPNYAKQRSNLAKKFGLGNTNKPAQEPAPATPSVAEPPTEKRNRKSKPSTKKKATTDSDSQTESVADK